MPHKHALTLLALPLAVCALLSATTPAAAADHYFGGGVRFFRTLNDVEIDDLGEIDADGNSIIASYLVDPAGLFKIEFDLEYFDDGYDDLTGEIISPQLLLLVGGNLYGGAGVGINFISDNSVGDDSSDPFFIGRLGLQLTLVPRIHLDLNANYQTDVFDKVFSGASSDAITLGAIVRLKIR